MWHRLSLRYPMRGAALLTVIMITAVIAIISIAMLMAQRVNIYETSLVDRISQLYAAMQGMQDRAKQELLSEALKQKGQLTTYEASYPVIHFSGIDMAGQISDAQGRFNINLLMQTAYRPYFAKLITTVDDQISAHDAMEIASMVSRWIMPINPREKGESVLMPHLPMAHRSELRSVPGISARLMQRLAPYVVALPKQVRVNLNAVSAPVLYSLFSSKEVSFEQVKGLLVCRQAHQGFANALVFVQCLQEQNLDDNAIASHLVTFNSQYYLLDVQVQQSEQQMHLQSLIALQSGSGRTQPTQGVASLLALARGEARLQDLSASSQASLDQLRATILWQSW